MPEPNPPSSNLTKRQPENKYEQIPAAPLRRQPRIANNENTRLRNRTGQPPIDTVHSNSVQSLFISRPSHTQRKKRNLRPLPKRNLLRFRKDPPHLHSRLPRQREALSRVQPLALLNPPLLILLNRRFRAKMLTLPQRRCAARSARKHVPRLPIARIFRPLLMNPSKRHGNAQSL